MGRCPLCFPSRGQLMVSCRRLLWESGRSRRRSFSGPGGRAPERPLVCLWENFDELLPTGQDAAPIISFWERKRGKEMKEQRASPPCSLHKRHIADCSVTLAGF